MSGGFNDDPLCGPAESAPTEFWGAERFDSEVWQDFSSRLEPQREVAALLSALRGATRILDVGAGNGLLARTIAQRFGRCTVVEPSDLNVQRLRASGADAFDVVQGTADALPFDDGAFDAVLSAWVLQYTPSPERAVAEIARVCAKSAGSRVLIVQAAPWNDLVALYNICARGLSLRPAHHGFLLSSAAAALEREGYRNISFAVVPVNLAFSEPTLEQRIDSAVRMTFDLHFGDLPPPPRVHEQLRAALRAYFEKSPLSLNDDGVLLTARVP